jgi:hypothetical protein
VNCVVIHAMLTQLRLIVSLADDGPQCLDVLLASQLRPTQEIRMKGLVGFDFNWLSLVALFDHHIDLVTGVIAPEMQVGSPPLIIQF